MVHDNIRGLNCKINTQQMRKECAYFYFLKNKISALLRHSFESLYSLISISR